MAEAPHAPADDEVDHGRVDPLELLIRILGTAAVAGAVWFRVWEPFPRLSVLGLLGTLIRRLRRSSTRRGRSSGATHDDGTVDDDRAAGCARHRRVRDRVDDNAVRAHRRSDRRADRRPRPPRDTRILLDFLPPRLFVRRVRACDSAARSAYEMRGSSCQARASPSTAPCSAATPTSIKRRSPASLRRFERCRGRPSTRAPSTRQARSHISPERLGRDTTFGNIIEAVERAERRRRRSRRRRTATPATSSTSPWPPPRSRSRSHATPGRPTVIIAAGACGIAAGTPLAILGAIGRAARKGAIIKGGRDLEILGVPM